MGDSRINRRGLGLFGLTAGLAAAIAPASAHRSRTGEFSPQDRTQIQELFARYLWTYDCSDEQEFLTLFTEDALIVGKGKPYRGKSAILDWLRHLIAIRDGEGNDIWMHEAGQFRFIPGHNGCIVHAYATHFNGNSEKLTRGVRSLGYFTCECVRDGGEWKFRRFSISSWDRTTVPWKKPLPWADLAPD